MVLLNFSAKVFLVLLDERKPPCSRHLRHRQSHPIRAILSHRHHKQSVHTNDDEINQEPGHHSKETRQRPVSELLFPLNTLQGRDGALLIALGPLQPLPGRHQPDPRPQDLHGALVVGLVDVLVVTARCEADVGLLAVEKAHPSFHEQCFLDDEEVQLVHLLGRLSLQEDETRGGLLQVLFGLVVLEMTWVWSRAFYDLSSLWALTA